MMSRKTQQHQRSQQIRRPLARLFLIGLLGMSLAVWGGTVQPSGQFGVGQLPQAKAQFLRPEAVAETVYQLLPNLPKENQYRSQETNEVALNNTLVSRLVRYHQYVKSRPTRFQIDWQLTMADYLGFNEVIKTSRYPGLNTLQSNPLEGDRKIIGQLTRSQRRELVDVLVSVYNPQRTNSPYPGRQEEHILPQPAPETFPSDTEPGTPPSNEPVSPPIKPPSSEPGDAELLLP